MSQSAESGTLSNAEIADRLSSVAQMLTVEKANPYKIRAYRRAAALVTDSHSTGEFRTIRYGIEQACRAGVEKTDVLNCQPLEALLGLLAPR